MGQADTIHLLSRILIRLTALASFRVHLHWAVPVHGPAESYFAEEDLLIPSSLGT